MRALLDHLFGLLRPGMEVSISADGTVDVRLRGCAATSCAWLSLGRRILVFGRDDSGLSARFRTGPGLKFLVAWAQQADEGPQFLGCRLVRVPKDAGAAPRPHACAQPAVRQPRASLRVTVIVPCYNHAPFLEKRLASIYSQTRPPDEILLLDDASTDHSLQLLRSAASADPVIGRTRVITSPENSGSPFRQWQKGLKAATGDLVWIAESDDWCAPDFLERLLPAFADPAVLLAHGLSVFVEADGRPAVQTQDRIFRSAGLGPTRASRIETGHQAANLGLGVRNILPNASAVVFRRPGPEFPLLTDVDWSTLRVCGDWIFYLHRIRGGKIAFVREATSYYRQHPANTSASGADPAPGIREHALVAAHLLATHRLGPDLFERHRRALHRERGLDTRNRAFASSLVALSTKTNGSRPRRPNVFVALHAFVTGGAEIFALHLAVALRALGCAVTLVELGALPAEASMLERVPKDLPIVRAPQSQPATLHRLLCDFGVEWIISNHPRTDLAFARALDHLASQKPPALFCVHHGFYHLDAGNLFHHRELLRHRVDRWINVSERGLAPFICAGLSDESSREKFMCLPVGIPLPPRPIADACLPPAGEVFVVVVASRAIPEKGWLRAIEAVGAARDKTGRDIRLVLAGVGPVFDRLRREGVPDHVTLHGHCSEVPRLFASAHLGLLATEYAGESCPLCVIECLAAGRPVVVTAVGETPAMLTAANGEIAGALVEPGERFTAKLADTIGRLATNATVYARAAALARSCAERHDIVRIAQTYLETWERLALRP